MKQAFIATKIDIKSEKIQELLCITVPEHTLIQVRWKSGYDKGSDRVSVGRLVYKPWPEEGASLMPGIEIGEEWEVLLSSDEVELL